jgi:drug/metabolite transporter (DMT)-like permease
MIYYYLALAAVLLTGAGQVLLKIGARKGGTWGVYINPATLAGYGMFLMVTICAIYALQGMELKTLYALMSVNPLVVMVLSVFVLKENLTKNKLIAVGLIFCGLLVFNL